MHLGKQTVTNTDYPLRLESVSKIHEEDHFFFITSYAVYRTAMATPHVLKSRNRMITCIYFCKGNRTIADLRYEEKYIISPSSLIFAPIKG